MSMKANSAQSVPGVAITEFSIIAFDKQNNILAIDPRRLDAYGKLFRKSATTGAVEAMDFTPAIAQLFGKAPQPTEVMNHNLGSLTVDDNGRIYIIYMAYKPFGTGLKKWLAREPILIFSSDNGKSFKAYSLPNDPELAFLETKMTTAPFTKTPLIGLTKSYGPVIKNSFAYNTLWVTQINLTANGTDLTLSPPITITTKSPGTSNHTGGYSSFATVGDYTYFSYNLVSDDEKMNNHYVASINRNTFKIDKTTFVGRLQPNLPDPHATPVLVYDKGKLHMVSGGQGFPYGYWRFQVSKGNLTQEDYQVLAGHRVYASLMADANATLYLLYMDYDPLPCLYLQRFNEKTNTWQLPEKLIAPPSMHKQMSKDNYGVYYFRIAPDNFGVPYISYSFWDTYQKQLYPRELIKFNKSNSQWNQVAE
ncbi:hypothetical protein [Chitinophaga sp. Cy-1792]|uniref:hypothetical protein n=1 Tax=Chitinophaga sp. Cy-1792 TaxID=2608339 RepID=UPI0014239FB5|nr:hypothetical protein [Chitinophaga sp. Cy-1792]NIG52081.1 hypothetical protein [Chitinophaga sp. Cy-1792]